MSALLTTTMVNMKATVEALQEAGVRDSVKVMVGGAPVTDAFAKQIGADAYAPDAASAVDVARSLVA
jgi:5-methyltetrahydrofolate--homocysteine methyltransferase